MFSLLRIALRTLARRPAITAVAVVSLAVGIGVNTAVFSLVDALFLRPPGVQQPESLVFVNGWFKDSGKAILDWSDCQEIRSQVPAFADATALMQRGGLWRNGDESTLLLVTVVADNYFRMLGVKPALGRLPQASESDSAPPIALAHWFWKEKMGADPEVIGRSMELSGRLYRVAAVLPAEFRGIEPMDSRHIWIPAASWTHYMKNDLNRGGGQFEALARLKPGQSMETAQTQLDALATRIEASDSRVAKGRRLVARSLGEEMRTRVRPGVLVLAVVGLVLLVACANVANALLASAEGRRREIGVRLALGAGRVALLKQFAMESGVLAVTGAASGLMIATWLISLAPVLAPPTSIPISFDLRLDGRLLAFTAASTLLTLLVFGLAPLTYSLRVSILEALSGARTAGLSHRAFLRNAFVTAQVALSVVVVGGAFVLLRAFNDAQAIYPGFDSSRPLALAWANKTNTSKPEVQAYEEAAARIAEIPGVESVTYARHLPLVSSGAGATLSVVPEGAAAGAPPNRVYFNLVGPKYFEVTGSRLLKGRMFELVDYRGGTGTAILNEEAARRFWPGQDALHKTIRAKEQLYEVVGIVPDAPIGTLHGTAQPAVYLPASRMPWGETIFMARTRTDPAAYLRDVSRAAALTGDTRVYQSMTLRTLTRQALYEDWMPTVLGGALAVIGLTLAAGGLFGAIAYSVQRRVREFGVRVALGADSAQIGSMVVRQALVICLAGVPIGAALFLLGYHYYGESLLRNRPLDFLALGGGALVSVLVVLAGAILPAIRASKVDPCVALRSE